MKKIILLTLMALCMSNVKSQDTIVPNRDGLTITTQQPIGFLFRNRYGVDYRVNNKGYGLTYSFYDRYDETYQLHFNMRLYGKSKIYKPSRGEVYTQFKVGTGGKGNKRYDFVGIGRGSRIYLDKKNHFIFETMWGFKVPFTYGNTSYFQSQGLKGLFFVIGPGSIIDLNFNLGYRF
jgi:hypothetical protein